MKGSEQKEILESWKEIAVYLDRNQKTCQRWEVELGLPIRRLDGTPKARVFAYRHELDSWLEARLNHRDSRAARSRRFSRANFRSRWIVFSSALGLIALSVLAVVFIPGIDWLMPAPAPEKPHLAVLPILNLTGDESCAYLRDALTTLIVRDLYQSRYIRILTSERLYEILDDMGKQHADSFTTEELKKIASLEGVTHFLTGAVTKSGDKVRLNISIQESGSWEAIWSDRLDGVDEDMFAVVDMLTSRLKPRLNLTAEQIADDVDGAVADVTTPNEHALRFYIQAQRAVNATEWGLAIEMFKRAVALDPDFAMAYRQMSGVYNHLALATREDLYWEKLREYGQKARDAARRRPPSERERLIIEGTYIYPPNPAEEMEIFKGLLDLYPDDDYGNYRLGTRYVQGMAYDQAERHLKRIVRFTNHAFSYYNLSKVYLDQAKYAEAEELMELGLTRFPRNSMIFQRMAMLHAMQLRFAEALLWCDRGFEVEPIQFRDSLVRGDVLFFMGDFAAAEEEYRLCLGSDNNQTRIKAAVSLMELYETQGRFGDAWRQAEQAKLSLTKNVSWDFDPLNIELARLNAGAGNIREALALCDEVVDGPTQYKLRGEIYLRAERWKDVEDILKEIEHAIGKYDQSEWAKYLVKNDIEGPYRKRLRNALYVINARAALRKGDYAQAIADMGRAEAVFPGTNMIAADIFGILAGAYYESGNLRSARQEYERITRITYNRKAFGGIFAESYYMLARICDEQGDEGRAMERYETFLDIWKHADPGLPKLELAERRMTALKSR